MQPSQYWWLIPIASLISAGLGAGAAIFGPLWRYKADYRRDIFQNLFTTIQEASDLGTEYWLLSPGVGDADIGRKCRSLEARIKGYSERIEASIDAARPHLRKIDTLGMELPWSRYLDSLTGGQFCDPRRPEDYERADAVQYEAANLIRELRLAADRRLLGDNSGILSRG